MAYLERETEGETQQHNKKIFAEVDETTYNRIKKSGLRIRHIIKLGLAANDDNPQLIMRISELEAQQEKLKKLLSNHAARLYELEKTKNINNTA